jgi:hypothetical protein
VLRELIVMYAYLRQSRSRLRGTEDDEKFSSLGNCTKYCDAGYINLTGGLLRIPPMTEHQISCPVRSSC